VKVRSNLGISVVLLLLLQLSRKFPLWVTSAKQSEVSEPEHKRYGKGRAHICLKLSFQQSGGVVEAQQNQLLLVVVLEPVLLLEPPRLGSIHEGPDP